MPTATSTCFFVSDLHLFANRSHGERHLEAIELAASRADTFVLGGDIFDFRWTTLRTIEETVDEAVRWLQELTDTHAGCQFHLLLGNHDYHQAFIDRLPELEAQSPNLAWDPFYVRLGQNVFLHGDVADRRMDAETLAAVRARCLEDRRHGPVKNLLYDVAVLARIHKLPPRVVYRNKTVARRILAYLEAIEQGPEQGVRHVYFGHTHVPLSGYRYGELTFHNGGAPIKGLDFRIVEVQSLNGE